MSQFVKDMEEEGGQADRRPSPVAGPSGIRGLRSWLTLATQIRE